MWYHFIPQKLDDSFADASRRLGWDHIDLCLISYNRLENSQANKNLDDWSVLIRGRHSPKQINTIQGAAEKQDELVSLNKHQTAYSQRQSNTALMFSTVCLPMTSTPDRQSYLLFSARSNPVLGLPLVLLWYAWSLLWVVAFFTIRNTSCLLWPRQSHDAKATSQCGEFSQMSGLSTWHYVDKE